jgi:hypothetical protein
VWRRVSEAEDRLFNAWLAHSTCLTTSRSALTRASERPMVPLAHKANKQQDRRPLGARFYEPDCPKKIVLRPLFAANRSMLRGQKGSRSEGQFGAVFLEPKLGRKRACPGYSRGDRWRPTDQTGSSSLGQRSVLCSAPMLAPEAIQARSKAISFAMAPRTNSQVRTGPGVLQGGQWRWAQPRPGGNESEPGFPCLSMKTRNVMVNGKAERKQPGCR